MIPSMDHAKTRTIAKTDQSDSQCDVKVSAFVPVVLQIQLAVSVIKVLDGSAFLVG